MPSPIASPTSRPPPRAGKDPRPRPALTGVQALLSTQRGITRIAYACAQGRVALELGWQLSRSELAEADAVAHPLALADAQALAIAIAHAFACEVTYSVVATTTRLECAYEHGTALVEIPGELSAAELGAVAQASSGAPSLDALVAAIATCLGRPVTVAPSPIQRPIP